MHLFRCIRCDHVDNADAVHAACARHGMEHPEDARTPKALVCTQCTLGYWHGEFAYRFFNPATDTLRVVNPPIH